MKTKYKLATCRISHTSATEDGERLRKRGLTPPRTLSTARKKWCLRHRREKWKVKAKESKRREGEEGKGDSERAVQKRGMGKEEETARNRERGREEEKERSEGRGVGGKGRMEEALPKPSSETTKTVFDMLHRREFAKNGRTGKVAEAGGRKKGRKNSRRYTRDPGD